MPLDAVFLTALTTELSDRIVRLKIDKIQQPEGDQIVLSLRGYGQSRRLLISAGTGDARVHLTEASFDNPPAPPMFCMLLRKHLGGAKIAGIVQQPLERACELQLDCTDALGTPSQKRLIVELMGRYSNVILVDGDGRIIDCLRRVDASMSEKRQVLPGLFYRPMPPQDKHSPLDTSEAEWTRLFNAASAEQAADKWLLDTFAGLSPLVCRELVFRASGETDTRVAMLRQADDGAAMQSAFMRLTADIRTGKYTPTLLVDGDGRPSEFSFMDILQYGDRRTSEQLESFSVLLETYYTRRFALERLRQRSQSLTKTVRNAHDRVRRKLENQRRELSAAADRERLRELGDILTANLHAMQKGQPSLTSADFYSDDGRDVTIKLDPKLTPQQNAAKYYKDYTKAKNAEVYLTEQITAGEQELDYLANVLDALARAESERDITDIRAELTETGYLKAPKSDKSGKQPGRGQKAGRGKKTQETAPMMFTSGTGFEIAVGRNNIENERLTHKLAHKTDVWLHAQKIPGSHVIVFTRGETPDDETLSEAASLAAYYSQARGSGKVAVDFTSVKNVKKIPGGRPGMVTYTDYKTIVAEPSESLAERLKG